MSYDIFLQRFVVGRPADVDHAPVRAVLETADYEGPDAFGFYVVRFPDGGSVEFSTQGLDGTAPFTGCAFHLRGISPDLVKFIFDVAKAGDMAILPAMEDFVVVLTTPRQRRELPADLRASDVRTVVCRSPAELAEVLAPGYVDWRTYRDRVVGRLQK